MKVRKLFIECSVTPRGLTLCLVEKKRGIDTNAGGGKDRPRGEDSLIVRRSRRHSVSEQNRGNKVKGVLIGLGTQLDSKGNRVRGVI
jgi:hypothetical protein